MEDTLLRIEEISKHFGGVYAVNEVNLNVDHGGIWGLVGPNGSGKSTLFNTILGLHKPDHGDIYFEDKCVTNLAPHQMYDLGLANAFQVPRLFYSMTVLDNMLVAARRQQGDKLFNGLFLRRRWQEQEKGLISEALDILDIVGLDELSFTPAKELSGGQRKLLELGRGLMAKPKLLLLDEPAAGINPVLGKRIFEKLRDLSKNGIAFFIVEHRLELLFEFASWVYVMDKGKLVLAGEPKTITDNPLFYSIYLGDE
ncbi:MAG: ABC transporter ATP-binding protein [Dehalococcoidales bacterium]|nr:ABC transporter ATP-binding protein [Dehalococcoidales bacterium]